MMFRHPYTVLGNQVVVQHRNVWEWLGNVEKAFRKYGRKLQISAERNHYLKNFDNRSTYHQYQLSRCTSKLRVNHAYATSGICNPLTKPRLAHKHACTSAQGHVAHSKRPHSTH